MVFSQTKAATPDGLVYRYALRELNPFVVQGVIFGDASGKDLIGRADDDHLYERPGMTPFKEMRGAITSEEGHDGDDFMLSGGSGNDILLGQ